jgi:hypothetical protein
MSTKVRLLPRGHIGYGGIRVSNPKDRFHYQVTGMVPFPKDMLRYDEAEFATPEDRAKAEISDEEAYCSPVARTINIIAKGCTPERWKSFLWSVHGTIEEHRNRGR